MTNKLHDQLTLLAPNGEVPIDIKLDAKQGRMDESSVGVVLGWLTKAGYYWENAYAHKTEYAIRIKKGNGDMLSYGEGDTTNEALAAAILKLPLEPTND